METATRMGGVIEGFMTPFFTALSITIFMMMGGALIVLVWEGLDKSLKPNESEFKEVIYEKISLRVKERVKERLETIILLKKR